VLLDEVEKAHADIFNMLLQIMEEGRLTDSFGRNIDFRNVILIMTSNIGASIIKNQSSLGFHKVTADNAYEKMREQLMGEIEKFFRPEFVNRLDEVIVFHSLTRADMAAILDVQLKEVRERLKEKGLALELTDEAREHLIDKGTNLEFGARPLRRAVERMLEDPMSEFILRGDFKGKDLVRVTLVGDELHFEAIESSKPVETGSS
jgi:ATP-dependent Clp protease ATP-binding subunit ClpC